MQLHKTKQGGNLKPSFELVKFDSEYLKYSWEWLNDPEIKKMTLTPNFSIEDQKKFFMSIEQRNGYWIKGIKYNHVPIGVMGIKNINSIEGEYWGYIGNKNYWGMGIGKLMLLAAVKKAEELSLSNLTLMVGNFNSRARNLYLKFGFNLESSHNGIEKYSLKL